MHESLLSRNACQSRSPKEGILKLLGSQLKIKVDIDYCRDL